MAMKRLSPFEKLWHGLFGWRLYNTPSAETITVEKAYETVRRTEPVVWPASMAGMSLKGKRTWKCTSGGVIPGTPAQNGGVMWRALTWGWHEWGEQELAKIPKPATGDYWVTGAPTGQYDRRCIVCAPDGSVHEIIYFEPEFPVTTLGNQALGWGKWVDGELVDGKPSTASGLPVHKYLWTEASGGAPHTMALVLPDYRFGDGTLFGDGMPVCGELLALRPESDSHKRMRAAGGLAAIIADTLVLRGCRVIDRSGYTDEAGTIPNVASLHFQAGAQLQGTNVLSLNISLSDLERGFLA